MDKEAFIISQFQNSFIGDDGAVVGKWVYSKDLFVEDTHFLRGWLSPAQIAQKAMLSNISDAIAMNAKPKYALIGAVVPKYFTKAMIEELSLSLKENARNFGVQIIGGDTIGGEKLALSITIISKKRAHTLTRKGLKKGDLIAFTGELGTSKKALDTLLKGENADENSRFFKPVLRAEFIKKAAPYLRCGLDISDGLSKELSRICALSKLGVEFLQVLNKDELCSGEEYEMLVAFAPKYKKQILRLAQKSNTPLCIFAEAVIGKYESVCAEHHFKDEN